MSEKPIVLLVDDDDRVLSSLARVLRREPYRVETAASGERALERIRGGTPVALVLTDYRMTGMTGTDLLKTVRSEHPEIARMLFSGWVDEIPTAELSAARLAAVHGKPWDDADLKASIRKALGLG